MTETTHTTAGLLAAAGAARLRAVAPAAYGSGACVIPASAAISQPASGGHQPTTWTKGAPAQPATFMVLDRKNRPTRLLSERSP